MRRLWTALASVLALWGAVSGGGKQCPDPTANPSCHCYNFENGIYLECPAATAQTLKMLLDVVTAPVQSLSVYEPDKGMVIFFKVDRVFWLQNNFCVISDQATKKYISGVGDDTPHPNIAVQHRRAARRFVATAEAEPGKFQPGVRQAERDTAESVQRS